MCCLTKLFFCWLSLQFKILKLFSSLSVSHSTLTSRSPFYLFCPYELMCSVCDNLTYMFVCINIYTHTCVYNTWMNIKLMALKTSVQDLHTVAAVPGAASEGRYSRWQAQLCQCSQEDGPAAVLVLLAMEGGSRRHKIWVYGLWGQTDPGPSFSTVYELHPPRPYASYIWIFLFVKQGHK